MMQSKMVLFIIFQAKLVKAIGKWNMIKIEQVPNNKRQTPNIKYQITNDK